jgi:FkbM family methyltransferase
MRIVQVGANKGNTDNDPVWKLVQANLPDSLDWHFVLIEPNPYACEKLVETYKAFKNVKIFYCGCADVDCQSTLYVDNLDEKSCSQHSSLIYDHLIKHDHKPEVIGLVSVILRTLNNLLDSSLPIDYLQIDVEGYDYKVLLGCDLTKFNIKKIQYEQCHLNEGEKQAAHEYLVKHGYKLIKMDLLDVIYEKK